MKRLPVEGLTRRGFVALAALAAAPASHAARLPIRKAVWFGMLPNDMPLDDRFKLAKDCGFEAIECPTQPDAEKAEAFRKAAQASGLKIHSVMNQAHWEFPLSSSKPEVVERSMQGMVASLENAERWGADTVLLVPAVVNPDTSYAQAWERSQAQIRKLIPIAEKRKVIIGIEEVWNKFLLSPLEMARYVDDFQSPWIRAYFDVGNVVLYGYPQDWIRTLGKRIVKLHIKDFSFKRDSGLKKNVADWVPLREGEINWKEVHRALADVGYTGTATLEISGGGEAHLREANKRFDLILNGE